MILLFVLFGTTCAFAQCSDENCGLTIRGKVLRAEADYSEKNAVKFKVWLDVEFGNEGNRPIILFKPEFDDGYWLGGWSLYPDENDAIKGKAIFSDGYWQSNSRGDSERNLSEKLNVKVPPAEYTKILQPKEIWKFQDEFQIYFEKDKNAFPPRKTWKELQAYPSTLWLRIAYELSPWNVENFKPDLIRKLRSRWNTIGNVLVEKEKEGKHNHFIISSAPMEIDFSQAKGYIANTEKSK